MQPIPTFSDFEKSDDTLWILSGDTVIFQSIKKGVAPLIDYLAGSTARSSAIIVYDRIVGNAAALLAIKAHAVHVTAVTGSRYAADTLGRYGVPYDFHCIVTSIINRTQDGMCPYERLSLNMEPDEFYEAAYAKITADRSVNVHRK